GRRHDGAAERHRRLADRRELDRVTAGAFERAADPGRHPQRQVGRVHDGVDLQVADVSVPELDARQTYPLRSVSVRRPTGPGAAWYTRGRRRDIAVTISQEIVVRYCARSAALIRSSPDDPSSTNSSSASTGGPGTSVTSAMTASIATLPTSGTRRPRTMALARFEWARAQPSP